MKSVMTHNFYSAPQANIERSSFNLSHGVKTTGDAGKLIPIACWEVIPGDTFNVSPTLFARLATPAVPFMDNLFLETFWFYCPSRLVWENFERMCGAQDNPGDSTDYLIPVMKDTQGISVETLGDYMGLPINVPLHNITALPFRMCNLIWNEWFRCEYLQNSLPVPKGDGPDEWSDYNVQRRTKRPDYYTSSLPWPQKGESIDLPLGSSAPIVGPSTLSFALFDNEGTQVGGSRNLYVNTNQLGAGANYNGPFMNTSGVSGSYQVRYSSGLEVDLSGATAATINSLRMAFQLQRLLERDARCGTRFKEVLFSHYHVISPDARLQRPEFLGGSSARININPIAQTSSTDSVTPQGNLAAIGVVGDSYHGFTKSFVEHGYVIGFVNIRADLTYQQGIDRMWTKQTRFDFFWPVLAHLGEQAVLQKEIYATGTDDDEKVFGYQERYAEYRYCNSHICGKFRSTYSQSLDVWHLAQKFESAPTLSADFIEDKPPIERVVAVTSEPQFLIDIFFNFNAVRPMPVYSIPGLIDHF